MDSMGKYMKIWEGFYHPHEIPVGLCEFMQVWDRLDIDVSPFASEKHARNRVEETTNSEDWKGSRLYMDVTCFIALSMCLLSVEMFFQGRQGLDP
jgi:hypothetical protein